MHKEPFDFDPYSDPLTGLLRRGGLPEPSPWFAARTLARLRHERGSLLRRWSFVWVRAAVFLGMIAFVLAGWQIKMKAENQRLTFSALETVAQGEENPFCGEDPSGGETLF